MDHSIERILREMEDLASKLEEKKRELNLLVPASAKCHLGKITIGINSISSLLRETRNEIHLAIDQHSYLPQFQPLTGENLKELMKGDSRRFQKNKRSK